MKIAKREFSEEDVATQAWEVLVQGRKATRALPKSQLLTLLKSPNYYARFLKECMENDRSQDLRYFRTGLLLVVRGLGPGEIARRAGINRVTLYRMLNESGNPGLKNLLALLAVLKMRLWVVDEEFIGSR